MMLMQLIKMMLMAEMTGEIKLLLLERSCAIGRQAAATATPTQA